MSGTRRTALLGIPGALCSRYNARRMKSSRREVLRTAAVAATGSVLHLSQAAPRPIPTGLASKPPALPNSHWNLPPPGPMATSPGTRPIGNLAIGGLTTPGMRRVKQLGVDHVLMGGPPIPWQESDIREPHGEIQVGGIYALQHDDRRVSEDDLRQAGTRRGDREGPRSPSAPPDKAGLAVVEYNFYAHRAMEGYYEETGRAGAGYTGFDYSRMKRPAAARERGRPQRWTKCGTTSPISSRR